MLNSFIFADEAEKTTVPPAAQMSINGNVADLDTQETLAGVLITIEGTNRKTHTDLDGNFSFKGLSAGNYELHISYISYKETEVKNIKITNTNKKLDLKLKSE